MSHSNPPLEAEHPRRSELIDKLTQALAEAQANYPTIKPSRLNENEELWADWDDIMSQIRPILGGQGLTLQQEVFERDDSTRWLYSRVSHVSGQWTETKIKIRNDAVKLTLFDVDVIMLCRILANAQLGITISDNSSDFGGDSYDKERIWERASRPMAPDSPPAYTAHNNAAVIPTRLVDNAQMTQINDELISQDQLSMIKREIGIYRQIEKSLKDKFVIDDLVWLPKKHFNSILDTIRSLREVYSR